MTRPNTEPGAWLTRVYRRKPHATHVTAIDGLRLDFPLPTELTADWSDDPRDFLWETLGFDPPLKLTGRASRHEVDAMTTDTPHALDVALSLPPRGPGHIGEGRDIGGTCYDVATLADDRQLCIALRPRPEPSPEGAEIFTDAEARAVFKVCSVALDNAPDRWNGC